MNVPHDQLVPAATEAVQRFADFATERELLFASCVCGLCGYALTTVWSEVPIHAEGSIENGSIMRAVRKKVSTLKSRTSMYLGIHHLQRRMVQLSSDS